MFAPLTFPVDILIMMTDHVRTLYETERETEDAMDYFTDYATDIDEIIANDDDRVVRCKGIATFVETYGAAHLYDAADRAINADWTEVEALMTGALPSEM